MDEPKSALGSTAFANTLDEHVANVKAQNQNKSKTNIVAIAPPWYKKPAILAAIGIGVVLLASGGVFGYMQLTKKPATPSPVAKTPAPTPTPVPPPAPTTKASPLTGAQLDPATADLPIQAVVIENHTDARPQSGLSSAGVVYEALAEGGITRFLAFFLESRPATLGPVRSIRTYFVDWALEFGAPVAHAGGNADALDLIGPTGMKDMNQFNYGGNFYRTTDRYAPHNLYTSSDMLSSLRTKLGFNTPATFTPTPRRSDDTAEATPSHPDIKINYSYNGYQVEYKFNASCNCYDRFLAGAPHIDRNSGKQIQVKNVIVEYMPTNYGTTRIGEQTVIMGTVGSGKSIVFLDGTAIEGTWSKASRTARTIVKDSAGKEIPLNVGSTWYSIVPDSKTVSY